MCLEELHLMPGRHAHAISDETNRRNRHGARGRSCGIVFTGNAVERRRATARRSRANRRTRGRDRWSKIIQGRGASGAGNGRLAECRPAAAAGGASYEN